MLKNKDKDPKVHKINKRIKYKIIAGHRGDSNIIESVNLDQSGRNYRAADEGEGLEFEDNEKYDNLGLSQKDLERTLPSRVGSRFKKGPVMDLNVSNDTDDPNNLF